MTLQESDITEGTELRSDITNIERAKVLKVNENGTYWIEEVDKDIGAHRYSAPLSQIDETFEVIG